MNQALTEYEVAIVGGGLAGLSLAILLGQQGVRTIVFEKGMYPRHKVCGEYISMESYGFLQRLGLPLDTLQLPLLQQFALTAPYGRVASCTLNPGGIGISRYTLDHLLAQQAQALGVDIRSNTRIQNIRFIADTNQFACTSAEGSTWCTKLAIGTYGRISGLHSTEKTHRKAFIGVKYHVSEGPAADLMEMHHFHGGYCGISRVEDGKYCMCYLAKADLLKPFKGDFNAFEAQILGKNPHLKKRLDAPRLMDGVRTAQIQFGIQATESLPYPLLGDAAGFIPPITGNGMSLAFRSAQVLYPHVLRALEHPENRPDLLRANKAYIHQYLNHRIQQGIFLQNLLFTPSPLVHRTLLFGLTYLPGMLQHLSKKASGTPF